MDELTTVLDELDSRQAGDGTTFLPHGRDRGYPTPSVQKLVAVLQSQGGDMARVASVIETLACDMPRESETALRTVPRGGVTMPGTRNDMRTLTAGNGIMTGTGM